MIMESQRKEGKSKVIQVLIAILNATPLFKQRAYQEGLQIVEEREGK